jgi:ATP-dependent DNA helicase RecQ
MSTTKRSTAKTSAKKKEPASAPAPKSRSRRAATVEEEPAETRRSPPGARARTKAKKTVEVVEAPPKPTYDLKGPIPPEGAKYPPKVGALLGVGQRALGIKEFRPGQAEAYAHLLAGEDVLAVMPTGSGKSLLYQLPSLILPGVTVVVSPLIALIKDQIDKMVAKGVTAVRVDSTLTVKQRREVDALVRSPGGKLLLTTPERMADPEFRVFLREAASGVGVSRFVVDEAHCVSQWGHDFRPAYLSLRKALEDVGRPPVLATTATAPPHVRDDILFQLGMEGATTVTTTFDRPNLHYEVIVFSDEDEKMRTLVTLLKKLPRPGIVYCATVKKVEELYEALTRWGVPVSRYHGRMNKGERDDNQVRFMESKELVMVATNAFGLGVDKPDIRNVLHYHVPGSLEAYAQEAGRGGRDGKPARCVLLFSPDDVAIQEYFLSGTYPTKRQVRQVYEAVEVFTEAARAGGQIAEDSPPNVANIALGSGVGQQRTRTVLSLLKDEKFIVEKDGGFFYIADPPLEEELLLERAKQYEARRIADRQRLDALLAYVKAPGCRNQVILQYLGEPEPAPCGRCDNCLRSRELALAASSEATRLGARLTKELDDDVVEAKPKREIKARVVRIDQPPAAPTPPTPAPAAKPTVLRRTKDAAPPPEPPPPRPAPAPVVRRAGSNGAPPPSVRAAEPPVTPPPPVAVAKSPKEVAETVARRIQQPAPEHENEVEDDDDLEDDDELEDDELEGDEEDGELVDDDDEDFDDDDDLDDDDEDDDGEDDDEDYEDDDDDEYEIDKTAAQLAQEGVEGSGEVTVLARKRVPKAPKQRPQRPVDTPSASAAEARRRRRRRRRKRRAMLPPKSAFTTPVLSTAAPIPEAQPRRGSGGGGPVIEYVRGPMRIAMAPVASANPNDAGVGRRTKKGGRRRGWDRGPDRRPPDRRFDGPPGAPRPPGAGPGPGAPGFQGDANGAPERRRRRRRRRRRGNGLPAEMRPNMPPQGDAPVSFFTPSGPQNQNPNGPQSSPQLGPDGQPLRKRRRRRRRGRGGRQREWRTMGGGGPPSDGGNNSGPPSGGGGGGGGSDFGASAASSSDLGGGGGAISDGD